VEDVTADEAEVTVDGGGSAAGKVPHLGLVVGEGRVGVLQEGDGNCKKLLVRLFSFGYSTLADCIQIRFKTYRASG
jgi:hypothetical protein